MHIFNRPLGLGIRFAGICAALLVGGASVPAQSVSAPGSGTVGPFAPPWSVTFQHIKDAMESNLGGFVSQQVRRVRREDRKTKVVSYPGTLEQLKFRPADALGEARFQLSFEGLEGQALTPGQRSAQRAAFARQAAFRFKFQSFRVSDVAQAEKVYRLVFLAYGKRTTLQGVRPVYRMAVLPRQWDRSLWLIELDVMTGYPLYAGQYSRFGGAQRELASELIVTSVRPGMRFPNSTKWWAPTLGVRRASTEAAALKAALPASQKYVRTRGQIPMSYRSLRYEVHTDPYKGNKHALLIYTDGIDHFFVRQRNVPVVARGADDSVAYLDRDGVTQCVFSHKGVEFLVVGRSDGLRVRDLSAGIFQRAISVLQ